MSQGDLLGREASVVLTAPRIRSLVESNVLIDKKTFDSSLLEACSYDLRIGSYGVAGGTGKEKDLAEEGLELTPGGYAGVVSWEKLTLPLNIFARIGAKRSYSYSGIILLTGNLVDPGYKGHLLFGIYNASQKKFVLRRGAKICSIVFEELPHDVDQRVQPSPDLLQGRIPDDFINNMANMEVLPWMQISERVKQIEKMASDILDLKQRYEDVLEPIKELTQNVDRVSQDVDKLADRTGEIRDATRENADQIRQLTSNLTLLQSQLAGSHDLAAKAERRIDDESQRVTDLSVRFGRISIVAYLFWAVVLLVLGALLPELIGRIFGE